MAFAVDNRAQDAIQRTVPMLCAVTLAAAALCLSPARALANAGPTRAIVHIGGGNLIPCRDAPVVVEREDLTIDLRVSEYERAKIAAAYVLRNEGPHIPSDAEL
ncbi:MAG: hypothetical protein HPY55_09825 [Firmicutes bacterium]|nr:hypothetical protein [Bacillota bacterium]